DQVDVRRREPAEEVPFEVLHGVHERHVHDDPSLGLLEDAPLGSVEEVSRGMPRAHEAAGSRVTPDLTHVFGERHRAPSLLRRTLVRECYAALRASSRRHATRVASAMIVIWGFTPMAVGKRLASAT